MLFSPVNRTISTSELSAALIQGLFGKLAPGLSAALTTESAGVPGSTEEHQAAACSMARVFDWSVSNAAKGNTARKDERTRALRIQALLREGVLMKPTHRETETH